MAVTGTLPGGGTERLGLGAGAGARVGATAVRTRTESAATGLGVTDGEIAVTSCAAGSTGDAVVTITYPFSFVTPVAALANLAKSSYTITATGRFPCGG